MSCVIEVRIRGSNQGLGPIPASKNEVLGLIPESKNHVVGPIPQITCVVIPEQHFRSARIESENPSPRDVIINIPSCFFIFSELFRKFHPELWSNVCP